MFLSAHRSTPSLTSRLLYQSLKISNFSEKVFTKLQNHPERRTNQISIHKINRKLLAVESYVDNSKIITVRGKTSSDKHIIFLHGGAYFAEAVKGHRKLMESFALSGFKVSFIDYPLSPENNAAITINLVEKAYNKITSGYPDDEFLLFGDSAGGGLALSLLLILLLLPSTLPFRKLRFSCPI